MNATALKRKRRSPAASMRTPQFQSAQLPLPFSSRFARSRCDEKYDLRTLLVLNPVNLTVPAPATNMEQIRAIAGGAFVPIPIDSLDSVLGERSSTRGAVFFRDLGNILNEFAVSYRDMIWWLSGAGLVMKIVEPPPCTAGLSTFNAIAGEIMSAIPSGKRLSTDDFHSIVGKLNMAGEGLKNNLQPAQREEIALYNQRHARTPMRTFSDTLKVPRFATSVRRRLYVARDAYRAALLLPRRHLEKYDTHLPRNTSILF